MPRIDSTESSPQAYIVWRAGTSNRFVVPARKAGNRFLGSLKGLQIQALDCSPFHNFWDTCVLNVQGACSSVPTNRRLLSSNSEGITKFFIYLTLRNLVQHVLSYFKRMLSMLLMRLRASSACAKK